MKAACDKAHNDVARLKEDIGYNSVLIQILKLLGLTQCTDAQLKLGNMAEILATIQKNAEGSIEKISRFFKGASGSSPLRTYSNLLQIKTTSGMTKRSGR
jgi:hypothetical protein